MKFRITHGQVGLYINWTCPHCLSKQQDSLGVYDCLLLVMHQEVKFECGDCEEASLVTLSLAPANLGGEFALCLLDSAISFAKSSVELAKIEYEEGGQAEGASGILGEFGLMPVPSVDDIREALRG
jgi:hypothetical protein